MRFPTETLAVGGTISGITQNLPGRPTLSVIGLRLSSMNLMSPSITGLEAFAGDSRTSKLTVIRGCPPGT